MTMTSWKIDESHSSIHFSVRHLVVAAVRGQFSRWHAELTTDDEDLTRSSVTVTIEGASVTTGNPQRDADLRSPNFFDVERFPELTFRSRRVEHAAPETYRVIGDLTIRGVTREIALVAEHGGFIQDPWGGRRTGFAARGSIDRRDFGMLWNQALDGGGVFVGDRVEIAIEIEAVAQAPQRAVA